MKRNWKLFLGIAIASAALGVIVVVVTTARRAAVATGPMVQMVTHNGFTLVWQIPNGSAATVTVQTVESQERQSLPVQPQNNRYEIAVVGLRPGTLYHYEIHTTGEHPVLFAEGQTRTAPPRGGSFRFLAFGDSGMGNAEQYELAALMPKYNPDLIIHTGDVVYPDGRSAHYPKKFYRPYAELLRHAALYPCIGNHDWDEWKGEPLFEHFVLPRNGPAGSIPERHYWFDFGDVRFICIDSNDNFENISKQVAPWVNSVLKDAGARWTIPFFHHPVYTNGKYPGAGKLLEMLVPLFDRHHVALALVGHNHMYECSHPIRDNRVVGPGEGTIYVTSGAGGGELYDIRDTPSPYLRIQNNKVHSFTVIDVTPTRLIVQQIDENDGVIDKFEITRAAPTTTSAPSTQPN